MAIGGASLSLTASVDYFWVDGDGYFVDTAHNNRLPGGKQLKVPRNIMKILSTARKHCNDYLGPAVRGVFVCEAGFLMLREFATGLGLLGLAGLERVCDLCEARFGKKRLWKHAKSALREFTAKRGGPEGAATILLHSGVDETVDLVRIRAGDRAAAAAWAAAMKDRAGADEMQ